MTSDKLHEAIGDITMAFAALDFITCAILAELMETNFETAVIVSAALEHRKKQQLISSLAKVKLKLAEKTLEKVSIFLAECRGMSKERNYAADLPLKFHPAAIGVSGCCMPGWAV